MTESQKQFATRGADAIRRSLEYFEQPKNVGSWAYNDTAKEEIIAGLKVALSALSERGVNHVVPADPSVDKGPAMVFPPSETPRTSWPLDTLVSLGLDDLFKAYGLTFPQTHSDLRRILVTAERYLAKQTTPSARRCKQCGHQEVE